MGLPGSGCPVTAMTAAARDSVAVGSLISGGALTSNGDKSALELPEGAAAGGLEVAAGGAARARRKRRHTCPDYRESPPPLENGWNGALCGRGRLSPPLRLSSLDASLDRAAGGCRTNGDSQGDNGPEQDGELKIKTAPANCVQSEDDQGSSVPDGVVLGNGEPSPEPPPLDGEGEPKQEPPDRPAEAAAASPPPPADTRKRNLTETQKLYLNSECHKTEILASKLRHTACRLSGAAAAAAQPPVLLPNGDEAALAAKRRRRGPVPRGGPTRGRRRSLDSPVTDSESDGPPHLEPEAPLAAAPRPRGRPRRGTPAPELREAESEADAVAFTFEASPGAEEWFRTFTRQEAGRLAVDDFSWAAAGGGQLLPYQMSAEKLFPRELVPGGGRPRPLRPPTLPDRWLPPLPPAAAAAEAARVAARPARPQVPAEWACLEELRRVLDCLGAAEQPRTAAEPPPPELAAVLTAWPANASLPELADALMTDAADWADAVSEPSRPPSSADDASSVSTDASVGSGGRRRPVKRRKNRTGWPRARVRKPSLLKTAVNRAAAAAEAEANTDRDTAGPS